MVSCSGVTPVVTAAASKTPAKDASAVGNGAFARHNRAQVTLTIISAVVFIVVVVVVVVVVVIVVGIVVVCTFGRRWRRRRRRR
jgi:cobalamin synthase